MQANDTTREKARQAELMGLMILPKPPEIKTQHHADRCHFP